MKRTADDPGGDEPTKKARTSSGHTLNFETPNAKEQEGRPAIPEDATGAGNPSTSSPSLHITRPVGPYAQREIYLQQQEAAGEIKFVYFLNDGHEQHNRWLIDLKNVYAKQLPNMPKEYIARLVLDRRHRSVAIVKRSGQLVGGITYRPFHPQRFAEIAFCAITATEQVKGYGTRLMNYTKEYARTRDNILYFLTFADNNAVGYFSKQGFVKEPSLPKDSWYGYIKDYEGGTLMECKIHPGINYSKLPELIRQQKEALEELISSRSQSYRIFAGLPALQQAKAEGRIVRVDPQSIPGVRAAGWQPEDPLQSGIVFVGGPVIGPPTPQNLHQFIQEAINVMRNHPEAWPFLEPVDGKLVPDYYDVIKDPIDLATMQKRLSSGVFYAHLEMFNSDMRKMFANARLYNAKETIYYKIASKLEMFYDQWIRSRCVFND